MSIRTATRLFLGHAPDDRGLARLVAERLDQAGLEVEEFSNHRPDDDFESELRAALQGVDQVVFLVTRQYATSEYLGIEIGAARMAGKPIYVLYDGLSESELPDYLNRFKVVPVTELSRLIEEATQAA